MCGICGWKGDDLRVYNSNMPKLYKCETILMYLSLNVLGFFKSRFCCTGNLVMNNLTVLGLFVSFRV